MRSPSRSRCTNAPLGYNTSMAVPILHFSDVLCVYAYVAEARVDELKRVFGGDVSLDFHYCQVFGDTREKIAEGWRDRGGFAGYNQHIVQVASRFEHVKVHPELWTKNPPTGSLSPHLFVKAVSVLESSGNAAPGSAERADRAVRRAFFEEARDVSARTEQLMLAEEVEIDRSALDECFERGLAHAALARDFELARKHDIAMSPTFIFNDGRQRLNGNVGFRIIEANVRELLRTPGHEASWC